MCSHGWEPLAQSFPSHYFNWLSYRICLESTAHQPINAVWILEIIHFSLLMSKWPVVLASRVLLSYFPHPSVKDVLGTVYGEKAWVWNSSVFNFWQDLTVVLSSGGCDRGHAGGEENALMWVVTQTNVNSSKDLISSHLQPLPTVFSPSPKTGSRGPFNSKLSRYPSLPSTSPTMVLCSTSEFLERRMYILSFSFSLWWHLPALFQTTQDYKWLLLLGFFSYSSDFPFSVSFVGPTFSIQTSDFKVLSPIGWPDLASK